MYIHKINSLRKILLENLYPPFGLISIQSRKFHDFSIALFQRVDKKIDNFDILRAEFNILRKTWKIIYVLHWI